jgi:hypothetical protein
MSTSTSTSASAGTGAGTWSVEVYLDEDDDGQTHAEAVLRTRAGTELGRVRTRFTTSAGCETPQVDEEFSACRALHAIAHDLLTATVVDVRHTTRPRLSRSSTAWAAKVPPAARSGLMRHAHSSPQ